MGPLSSLTRCHCRPSTDIPGYNPGSPEGLTRHHLHPHLRAYDENPETGEVDTAYTKAVGLRFGQWILDTAKADYDQTWLDYQYEIGLRHHRSKKNKTDGGHTLGHIRARDLLPFSAAIVAPMKPYLEKGGHSADVVSRMYDAWWKSMILQVTLWSQPYMREGDF